MNYLKIALLVVVVLMVLYLVARRIKPFGQSIAFVCVVASRIPVTLAANMKQAAAYCHEACLASLHYPPNTTDNDYWQGVNVISRLVYFVIAVCILVGETLNTLLVLPSLFHTASRFQLPGFVEIASAALFICTPALFGAVILECCNLIPHGAGLFPHMEKLFRWVLGVLSGGFLLLAILLTGYFYLFRGAYLLDPESAQGMSLYILGGLGLLIAAVSVFALWALVVGSVGVVSVALWGGEKLCEAFASAFSLLPELFDVFALHLSSGTIGVGGTQLARDPHKYPSFSGRTSQPGFPETALLPGHASLDDTYTETIIPVETEELENTMRHPDKNASIVFVGSFGSKMFTPIVQKIAALRAVGSILTSAYLDLSITHVHTAIPGIVDKTPSPEVRKTALLHGETEGQAYTTLLNQLADRLMETHLETKADPAPLIFVIDRHCLSAAVAMLASLKHRLPLHSVVVVTSVSALDAQNTQVQTGITALMKLHVFVK